MKTKLILISVLIVAAALVFYFGFYKKPAAGTAQDSSPVGDASDNAAVQQIIGLVQSSQFAGDLTYIESIYPNYKMGGSNQPSVSSEYATLSVNGIRVVPNTVAMMQAIWNGWLGTYTTDGQRDGATPAAGKTQAQADAAGQLARAAAQVWSNYKQSYTLAHL